MVDPTEMHTEEFEPVDVRLLGSRAPAVVHSDAVKYVDPARMRVGQQRIQKEFAQLEDAVRDVFEVLDKAQGQPELQAGATKAARQIIEEALNEGPAKKDKSIGRPIETTNLRDALVLVRDRKKVGFDRVATFLEGAYDEAREAHDVRMDDLDARRQQMEQSVAARFEHQVGDLDAQRRQAAVQLDDLDTQRRELAGRLDDLDAARRQAQRQAQSAAGTHEADDPTEVLRRGRGHDPPAPHAAGDPSQPPTRLGLSSSLLTMQNRRVAAGSRKVQGWLEGIQSRVQSVVDKQLINHINRRDARLARQAQRTAAQPQSSGREIGN